jgi:hypothetical protein
MRHREPVLSAMLLAKADDALVIGDQRTSKLDCRGNQKPVRWVAVLDVMELIAASGLVTKRRCFDAGTIEEASDPRCDKERRGRSVLYQREAQSSKP